MSNRTTVKTRMAIVISALLVGLSHPISAATDEATASVILKATFLPPPCTLEGPPSGSVNLGSINQGTKSYAPFRLEIRCPDAATEAHIYAEARGPRGHSMATASRVNMNHISDMPGDPAQLWLTESGSSTEIPLGTDGASDPSKRFCKGRGLHWTCTLTPWTLVTASTPRGKTTAWITFTIVVP